MNFKSNLIQTLTGVISFCFAFLWYERNSFLLRCWVVSLSDDDSDVNVVSLIAAGLASARSREGKAFSIFALFMFPPFFSRLRIDLRLKGVSSKFLVCIIAFSKHKGVVVGSQKSITLRKSVFLRAFEKKNGQESFGCTGWCERHTGSGESPFYVSYGATFACNIVCLTRNFLFLLC